MNWSGMQVPEVTAVSFVDAGMAVISMEVRAFAVVTSTLRALRRVLLARVMIVFTIYTLKEIRFAEEVRAGAVRRR